LYDLEHLKHLKFEKAKNPIGYKEEKLWPNCKRNKIKIETPKPKVKLKCEVNSK
jgi:hypothetical protein